MKIIKQYIRRNKRFYMLALWIMRLSAPFRHQNPLIVLYRYLQFFYDIRQYKKMPHSERIRLFDLYPFLFDKTKSTPLDLYYFHQDTWAAEKIFRAKPSFHVDIGSTALLVGILAKFTKVCSIDIRPLVVNLDGLDACSGDILALPFADKTVQSLSSLCVIEHIGLGRYGDQLKPLGTDIAAAELQRVIAPGGDLYISVPIWKEDRVLFNGCREFAFDSFLAKFPELSLIENRFIQVQSGYGYIYDKLEDINFTYNSVFCLFHFRRERNH